MSISARVSWALGSGLGGLCLVVVPVLAQQPDAKVQRVATGATTAATAPPAPAVTVLGTIDLEEALRKYDKFKVNSEEFAAAVQARKADLMQIMNDAKLASEKMSKLAPSSPDYKKVEIEITSLAAKGEAMKQQSQMEFARREAESVATVYNEIQAMVARVAPYRKITHVIKTSSSPVSGSDPESVGLAMSKAMIYSDPRNDITNDVVLHLNNAYRQAGGVAPKPRAAAPGTTPAAPTAPAAGQGR
ncbi:OmpH family outer membrane protein [Isosphaeraceae bacterium EP7]